MIIGVVLKESINCSIIFISLSSIHFLRIKSRTTTFPIILLPSQFASSLEVINEEDDEGREDDSEMKCN
jgi:hypothetical protein